MEINTKNFPADEGIAEGVQVKWIAFNLLLVTGSKGFLACPVIDVEACQRFGKAAALVESSPENPIGTLERFADRKITKANALAEELGIRIGMEARDAIALIA